MFLCINPHPALSLIEGFNFRTGEHAMPKKATAKKTKLKPSKG
jgi:hypothetical protein